MRRLGKTLGVEAMSLYRHVRDKSDVLDGIHALVLQEVSVAPSGNWKEDLHDLAWQLHLALCRHPNTVPIFATRPAIGVGSLTKLERALAVMFDVGFDEHVALACVHALLFLVVGHATYRHAEQVAAADYDELDAASHPNVLRIAAILPDYDADEELRLGIDTFIAGLATRLPT